MLEPIDLLKVEKNAEEKLQNLASTQATKRKSDLLACANDTATDAAVAGLDMKETRFAQVSLDALNDLQSYVKCKRCGGDVSVRTGEHECALAIKMIISCEICSDSMPVRSSPV